MPAIAGVGIPDPSDDSNIAQGRGLNREPNGGSATPKRSPEHRRRRHTVAVDGGRFATRATDHEMMREVVLKLRMLTLKPVGCLAMSIVDGDEHTIADSGHVRRMGMKKFSESRPPLDAKILQDDL
jgi:hypothetical protein